MKFFDDIRINSSSVSNRCSYSKKLYQLEMTKLIILNEEMKGIMEIVRSIEELGLFLKGVNKTIGN